MTAPPLRPSRAAARAPAADTAPAAPTVGAPSAAPTVGEAPGGTAANAGDAAPAGTDTPLRPLLHGIVLVGTVGLAVELLLLEHWDSPWQLAPLALLAAALVASLAAWRRPGRATLRALRLVMGLCVAAGALGVWLHYDGNAEFERESDPTIHGLALVRAAITGATPALAPGALAQLGLLGLLLAWRHPADTAPGARSPRPRSSPHSPGRRPATSDLPTSP